MMFGCKYDVVTSHCIVVVLSDFPNVFISHGGEFYKVIYSRILPINYLVYHYCVEYLTVRQIFTLEIFKPDHKH